MVEWKRGALALLAVASLVALPAAQAAETAPAGKAEAVETETGKVHRITVDGQTISYRARAGTLIIRDDAGQPRASMFYVAYTREGAAAKNRPVTFLTNGGPGSASLWLNVGGFGPVRAPTQTPRATPPAPYREQENLFTLLGHSDLVFLDAIGTGYSRTIGDTPVNAYWGVDQDIDAFARGITRYIAKFDRWNSPRFLLGESYGTTRSAGLVYKLQNQGLDFNGVVLLSTLLNFGTGFQGSDIDAINLVPTLAATAWYHQRSASHPADLDTYLEQARDFAFGPYASALLKGDRLSPDEEDSVARQLSGFTGLSVDFLKKNKLRVGMEQYRNELLAGKGIVIGRFDTRFTAPASYASGDGTFDPATNDAATAGVTSAHLSLFRQHLVRDIGYISERHYRPLYNAVIEPQWDNRHKAPGIDQPLPFANTGLDLAGALQRNPHLKVLIMGGVYDLATPYAGAEYDISQLYLTPNLRRNVRFSHYRSGHMTYVDDTALAKMKADLDRFYGWALQR
ncbi:S10 family peptidase [Novosphingobium beihaiensis]|uniref:Peptidase S10 n=1 Tax=Novosphingobium beihaiensis TaxID=2930389 RepID=A0ABT0BL36_9SPHN|nr:peptidase S10 [Novosphingobium beihaiensis]MCJ2185765.1 peptidase S10 [Novosphingobium beihaiensis]